jgi:hypothetical protein
LEQTTVFRKLSHHPFEVLIEFVNSSSVLQHPTSRGD